MSNGMTNIELLLMLSENARAEGDDLITEQNKLNAAHARKLADLSRMIDAAREIVEGEKVRFQRWLPREDRPRNEAPPARQLPPENPMPRVVSGAGTPIKG